MPMCGSESLWDHGPVCSRKNIVLYDIHDTAAAMILRSKFSNAKLVPLGTEKASEVELNNLVLVGGPIVNRYVHQYWPEITSFSRLTHWRYFIDSKIRDNGTKVTTVFGSEGKETLVAAQSYPNLPLSPPIRFEVSPINNPSGLPIPPDSLQVQSVGLAHTENFLTNGYVVAEGILSAIRLIEGDSYEFNQLSILDFGCGCARILRWFYDLPLGCQLYGVDVNRKAIEWCKKAIPFVGFEANDPLPPLSFPDENFDIIFGFSVLTHLDEEYQFAWLKELQRIAKPGSIVILSVHGEDIARKDLSGDECTTLHEKGFLYKRVVENGGWDGNPDFYQATWHTRRYIEQVWSRYFRILAYVKYGPSHFQDLVVMERSGLRPRSTNWTGAKYIYIDMPIASLGTPRLGEVVCTDDLQVSGWCFYPYGDATRCYLDIWIDRERVDSCFADQPRPDVAHDYPIFPSASLSGFTRVLKIDNLKGGRHTLELTGGTNIMPLHRRFFFKV